MVFVWRRRCRRRLYLRVPAVTHTSKNHMWVSTAILAVFGLVVAVHLPDAAAVGVLMAVTIVLLIKWAQWQKHHH